MMRFKENPMKLEEIRKFLNFRELGGLKTPDGFEVVKGQFYRSGALGDLSPEELEYVRSLGIKHVFDFRSDYEINDLPDPDIGAVYHKMNALTDKDGNQIKFDPESIAKVTGGNPGAYFLEMMYGTLPFSYAYKEMFKVILAKETPILFHCTAGKDRTGIGALLILLMLGVDEETALDDYELTNEYRAEQIQRMFEKMAAVIAADPSEKEKLTAFEGVLRSSAVYSLQKIREVYGTYDSFFEKELGIDENSRQEMKNTYLQL
jgi:protein-tyrosine phosphatase